MIVYVCPLGTQEVEAKNQESKACLKKEKGWGLGGCLLAKCTPHKNEGLNSIPRSQERKRKRKQARLSGTCWESRQRQHPPASQLTPATSEIREEGREGEKRRKVPKVNFWSLHIHMHTSMGTIYIRASPREHTITQNIHKTNSKRTLTHVHLKQTNNSTSWR